MTPATPAPLERLGLTKEEADLASTWHDQEVARLEGLIKEEEQRYGWWGLRRRRAPRRTCLTLDMLRSELQIHREAGWRWSLVNNPWVRAMLADHRQARQRVNSSAAEDEARQRVQEQMQQVLDDVMKDMGVSGITVSIPATAQPEEAAELTRQISDAILGDVLSPPEAP